MNVVVISGTVSDDAKEFATKNGKMFVKLSVKNVTLNGQYESTCYVPVICFGRAAEASRGAKAGAFCEVQGTLSSRKNDAGKYEISVVADKITVSSGGQDNTFASVTDEDVPF